MRAITANGCHQLELWRKKIATDEAGHVRICLQTKIFHERSYRQNSKIVEAAYVAMEIIKMAAVSFMRRTTVRHLLTDVHMIWIYVILMKNNIKMR